MPAEPMISLIVVLPSAFVSIVGMVTGLGITFFFSSKNEADQFYNNMVKDIQNVGIPLTKDNIYGGMSNRKKPVSVFKWVYVFPPVKVKKPSPSNIEPEEAVGKYKVELGVYKRKHK
jgi:hypothetical protein